MADLCPAATWTAIPALDRESTPAILFAPGCLPGTADRSGTCATRDLRYTIVIPWDTFLAQARKAPGGNLYWEASVPADRRNPTAFWLMNQMAIRNLAAFQERGAGERELVSSALNRGFVMKIGLVTVPVDPNPNETLDALIKRGGQLFYPPGSPYHAFGGDKPIYSLVPRQLVGQTQAQAAAGRGQRSATEKLMYGAIPSWMENVREVNVHAAYDVAANRINYYIRLAWTNAGARVVDSAVRWLEQNVAKLCAKLNDPKVVTATTAASAAPVTAPYAAGATTMRTICNAPANYAAMTGCIPRPPGSPGSVEALLATPVILSAKYMRMASLPGANKPPTRATPFLPATSMTVTSMPAAATPTTPSTSTSTLPVGSIAWRNPATDGFDIAVPAPGPGTTHRVVVMTAPTPPVGVQVVDRATWERATLPWVRRRTSKIGIGAVALVVAITGTAVAIRAA